MTERLTWAVPGATLADLGLESSGPLFSGRALGARSETLAESRVRARLQLPLPGTPDVRGNLTEKPGALGTGWLWLTVYRHSFGELLRARLSAPRSESLAEREWNLICHLRARGIATPDPLLVGARGVGFFASHSFLLVRAPEDAFPLARWLRTDGIGAERARGFEALAQFLARLARAGVALRPLHAADVWLTPSGSGECETHDAAHPAGHAAGPAAAHTAGPTGGLRKNKLPGVMLVEVRGARLAPKPMEPLAPAVLAPLLAELATETSAAERAQLLAALR